MWTAKAQISLHIRAVWSGPSLSAKRLTGHYRMYQWSTNAQMRVEHAWEESESVQFVRARRHIFAWGGPDLRGLEEPGNVYNIFYKGDNFCEFLFTFLCTKPLLKKGVHSKRKESPPTLHPWLSKFCPGKILIWLRECAGWSESLLGAHVRKYLFWCRSLCIYLRRCVAAECEYTIEKDNDTNNRSWKQPGSIKPWKYRN